MFARKVSVCLRPDSLRQFVHVIECDVVPWLRGKEGFLDLITLSVHGGKEITTISFWDHEINAQVYNASGFPEVWRILEGLLDGPPYVKTFDVVGSTLPRLDPTRPDNTGDLPGSS